jgi:DNA-binding NarL/FixJ family response regulator
MPTSWPQAREIRSQSKEQIQMRVLLVDDYPPFLAALMLLLRQEPEIEIVGRAHDGGDGLKLADALQPDLVLADYAMPTMNGIALLRELKKRADAPKVVMLSFHAEPEYRDMALHAGADGYLVKTEIYKELLPLLRSLIEQIPRRA